MKKLLEFASLVLVLQGAAGLVHHFFGWLEGWGLVQRWGFLTGLEIYASLVLVVLGVAVGGLAERLGGAAASASG